MGNMVFDHAKIWEHMGTYGNIRENRVFRIPMADVPFPGLIARFKLNISGLPRAEREQIRLGFEGHVGPFRILLPKCPTIRQNHLKPAHLLQCFA